MERTHRFQSATSWHKHVQRWLVGGMTGMMMVGVLPQEAAAQTALPGCEPGSNTTAVLYQHLNRTGAALSIQPSTLGLEYQFGLDVNFNNQVTSLCVPPHSRLTVYEKSTTETESEELRMLVRRVLTNVSSQPMIIGDLRQYDYLGGGNGLSNTMRLSLNDTISMVHLERLTDLPMCEAGPPNQAILYEHLDSVGVLHNVSMDETFPLHFAGTYNKPSSICLPAHSRLKVIGGWNASAQETYTVLENPTSRAKLFRDLRQYNYTHGPGPYIALNDAIAAVQLKRIATPDTNCEGPYKMGFLYEHSSYTGRGLGIEQGEAVVLGPDFDNQATSLCLPPHTRLTLFNDSNPYDQTANRSYLYNPNPWPRYIADLGSESFQYGRTDPTSSYVLGDRISAVKLEARAGADTNCEGSEQFGFLYEHNNYQGRPLIVPPGRTFATYPMTRLASSLCVPPWARLVVWDDQGNKAYFSNYTNEAKYFQNLNDYKYNGTSKSVNDSIYVATLQPMAR